MRSLSCSGVIILLGASLLLTLCALIIVSTSVTCQLDFGNSRILHAGHFKDTNSELEVPLEKLEQLKETRDWVVDYISTSKEPGQRIDKCMLIMTLLMGEAPNSTDDFKENVIGISPYFTFIHAYHVSIPALDSWEETYAYYQNTRPIHLLIWQAQRDWNFLNRFETSCTNKYAEALEFNKDPQDVEDSIRIKKAVDLCVDNPLIQEMRTINPYISTPTLQLTYFEERVFKACRGSLQSMMDAFIYSVFPMGKDNQELPYLYSPFENMIADVELMETQIMEMRQEMIDITRHYSSLEDWDNYNHYHRTFSPVIIMASASPGYLPWAALNSKSKHPSAADIKPHREESMKWFQEEVVYVYYDVQATLAKRTGLFYGVLLQEWKDVKLFVADVDGRSQILICEFGGL